MYRVLMTGSRTWKSYQTIMRALKETRDDNTWNEPMVLVHGAAAGADTMAATAAEALGWEVEAHPADWDKFGKRAGFLRNAEMVATNPNILLAFIRDDSKGATMTLNLAIKAGVPTREYREWEGVPQR